MKTTVVLFDDASNLVWDMVSIQRLFYNFMRNGSVCIGEIEPHDCQVPFAFACFLDKLGDPDTPGAPPFWTLVSKYWLSNMKLVRRLESTAKKTLHSTLSNEIVLNCLMVRESSSFGTKHPSTLCQHSGILSFFHAEFNSFHRIFSSLSHFLYTL